MTKEELHRLGNLMQSLLGWLELGRLDKAREAALEMVAYLTTEAGRNGETMH